MAIDATTVEWIPFRDYAGANHVLGAGCCFIDPANGNQYFWDCVQWDGARQDLTIYRLVAATNVFEPVATFQGTVNAERGFERGQAQIGQGGALIIGTTMIPKGVPKVTTTGFIGVRCRIPGIDAAWRMGAEADPAIAARITALEGRSAALERLAALQAQQLTAIETALGNVSTGVLSEADIKALEWVKALMRLLSIGAV